MVCVCVYFFSSHILLCFLSTLLAPAFLFVLLLVIVCVFFFFFFPTLFDRHFVLLSWILRALWIANELNWSSVFNLLVSDQFNAIETRHMHTNKQITKYKFTFVETLGNCVQSIDCNQIYYLHCIHTRIESKKQPRPRSQLQPQHI